MSHKKTVWGLPGPASNMRSPVFRDPILSSIIPIHTAVPISYPLLGAVAQVPATASALELLDCVRDLV